MGIIQKNPLDGMVSQFYTLGLNNNLLVVGLGNMGKEFDGTRHNIGFECIDEFVEQNKFDSWVEKKDLKCFYTSKNLGSTRVIAIKPTNLMNLSGEAVDKVIHFFKLEPEKTVIVHDELDIPFGQLRMRVGGSDAGHNGIKSVIEKIGENFGRVRVGIGPKIPEQMDSADFVLSKFSKEQIEELDGLKKEVNAILTEYVYSGKLSNETRNFIINI